MTKVKNGDGSFYKSSENGDDDENVAFLRRPVIVSQPEHLVVDNGMTISLPCMVDQIPGGQ